MTAAAGDRLTLEAGQLQVLLDVLRDRGYCTVGPVVRDGAILYDEISRTEDLPLGWTDQQEAGTYRLAERNDEALFGYVVGPQSWKRLLHPPREKLWQVENLDGELSFVEVDNSLETKYAFLGVRSCELHAIARQDTVLMEGAYVDTGYAARRRDLFVVAVNCTQAGGTCFCASMNTGPGVTGGFDLALTEILEDGSHYFVLEVGTESGADIISHLDGRPTTDSERDTAVAAVERAASGMGRKLDADNVAQLLSGNLDHPHWGEVADRCLSCANCTMVCPTCFCTDVEEVTDLEGENAERWRSWDSCFSVDFSYIHGGSVRPSTQARYRHWLTHKLATWKDQFGSSGCVGCGRCITWCPVGIDITAEVAAIGEGQEASEDAV